LKIFSPYRKINVGKRRNMTDKHEQNPTSAVNFVEKIPCPFDEDFLRIVRYLCSCGHVQPLCRLYFCRYCSDLRCGQCVSHEVDSHYCPNCLENMPSAEARLKKNRCANCFDCPSCGHTLSTRATSMTIAAPLTEGEAQPSKPMTKKVYYLACGFCRWTTRDIGLPDQGVASGGWPEPENPDAARFASLEDHYRSIAQREKLEKESRRFLGRKLSYMQLADKYGLSAAVARRKAGLPPIIQRNSTSDTSTLEKSGGKSISVAPSEAKQIEDIEVLDSTDLFSKEPDLCTISRLEQRLMQIDTQPALTADVYPRHKHLVVKRSQRCRICEHNLSKPEYNPSSIKFKIQLAAFYHVPEIIIFQLSNQPLVSDNDMSFILKVTNPAQHPTYVEFFDLDEYFEQEVISNNNAVEDANKLEEDQNSKDGNDSTIKKSDSNMVKTSGNNLNLPLKSEQLATKFKTFANAKFISLTKGPNSKVSEERVKTYLPARDDAAEFDDHDRDFPTGIVDDSRIVAWRKSNKVGIKAKAKLNCDLTPGTEVITGFALRFLYTNTVPSLEQREIQTTEITIPVFVVLGKCSS